MLYKNSSINQYSPSLWALPLTQAFFKSNLLWHGGVDVSKPDPWIATICVRSLSHPVGRNTIDSTNMTMSPFLKREQGNDSLCRY